MSKRLEDFIRNNRTEFDDLEPGADLWNKIGAGLKLEQPEQSKKKEAKTFSLAFVLRVAAIIVVVMGVSFFFYLQLRPNRVDIAAINPEFAKQQKRYVSLVNEKRTELKTLTRTNPELYREFSAELAKMDSSYKKLNRELVTSPNQERVLRAMIRNLQVQAEVLNQQLNVIEQFNEFNQQKDTKNETKSI